MTNVLACAITDAAEDLGYPPLEQDPKYSGRCMFGATTWAVVGPRADIEAAINYAALAWTDPVLKNPRPDLLVESKRLRWDQMGKTDSVCY